MTPRSFQRNLLPLLTVAVLASWAAGCRQVNYPNRESGGSEPGTPVMRVTRELNADTLSSHGLETIWTQEALSGRFRTIHVVGDDLFAVEEQRHGRGKAARRSYVLIAFGRDDGLRRWEWDLKAPVTHAPFVYHYPKSGTGVREDEVLLVQKDTVYCLDYKHGTTLWKARLPFSVSSGVVATDTHYFVGSTDGRYFGLSKKSDFADWLWFTDDGEVTTSGVTRGIFTYFTATNGKAYRFHSTRGMKDSRAWFFATGARVRGAPALFSPYVFVGSSDYKLYCLRDIDGSKAWDFQAQAPILDTPVVVKYRPNLPIVFCISDDSRPSVNGRTLWAVNANEKQGGKLLWRLQHVDHVVAVGRRTVYVETDPRSKQGRSLRAIDGDTGKERFSIGLDGFDFVPATVGIQAPTRRHRSIIYLINKAGLIQAIGERL